MEVEHYTDWASEAREDGYDEGLARAVAGIMNRLGCSAEEAMETANVPENRKKDVLDLVTYDGVTFSTISPSTSKNE